VFIAALLFALSFALPSSIRAQDSQHATDQASRRALLSSAKSWAYQLRIDDLAPLLASNADLLVIDHGYDVRQNGRSLFDAGEVARLKIKPDGSRRIVLAYMSIGEVEQYRFYWQGAWCKRATAPLWIGSVNPAWPGNYPVRFWDAGWQDLILAPDNGYLVRIQAQGFDGVYLDRVDVYTEWMSEHPDAERDMTIFLDRIAVAARRNNPGFLVVMQNAEELLANREVRRLLDGIAKEDLLHGADFTEASNDAESVASSLKELRRARAAGLPVFTVEYLSDPATITATRMRLSALGFVPYFAPRHLDRLLPQPGLDAGHPPTAPALRKPTDQPSSEPDAVPAWADGAPTCLLD
jgi:cysteinyl-tRNA synthetase